MFKIKLAYYTQFQQKFYSNQQFMFNNIQQYLIISDLNQMENSNHENETSETAKNVKNVNFCANSKYNYSDEEDNKDILEYSQQDPSINFVVEDEKQDIPFEKILDFKQEPQKKKYRDIFGKYKKKTQEPINLPQRTSGGFLKTFDQLFHLGEFSSQIKQKKNEQKKSPGKANIVSSKIQDSLAKKSKEDTKIDKNIISNQEVELDDEMLNKISVIREKIENNSAYEEQDLQQLLTIIKQDAEQTKINQNSNEQTQIVTNQQKKLKKMKRILVKIQQKFEKESSLKHQNISANQYITKNIVSNKIYDKQQSFNQTLTKKDPLAETVDSQRTLQLNISENSQKSGSQKQSKAKVITSILTLKNKLLKSQLKVEYSNYPIFIRQVCKLNELYPNFHFPNFQPDSPEHKLQIVNLVQAFRGVVNFLIQISQQISKQSTLTKENLIVFKKQHKLEHFLNSGWQKTIAINDIDKIRPIKPFLTRSFDYQKIAVALSNYKQIIDYYKNPNLKLETEQGRKKYMSLRRKFWEIEKNIQLISQDLYSQTLRYFYPQHYHEFLQFLKNKTPQDHNSNIIQQRKYLLAKYLHLKNKNDPLTCSEVGLQLKKKLENQLTSLCPKAE